MRQAKRFIVVNPEAGAGKALHVWRQIKEMVDNPGSVEYALTRGAGHATDLSREAYKSGFQRMIAVGGDGTFSEMINGIPPGEAEVGVIPAGTGNDFARTAGLPLKPAAALHTAMEGNSQSLDLGWVDGNLFANVLGIGFDAQVVKAAQRFAWAGKTRYWFGLLAALKSFSQAEYSIGVDGFMTRVKSPLAVVGNGRTFGSGLEVTPKALLDDGQLDLCYLTDGSLSDLVKIIPRVVRGSHLDHPKVKYLRGRTINVECEPPCLVQADGELVGKTPVKIKVLPGKLKLTGVQ